MDQFITEQLKNYSNHQFSMPNYRKIHLPKQERHNSFSQLSNWTNSDKLLSSKLPAIYSKYDLKNQKLKEIRHSEPNNPFTCPIKQMDINLHPITQMESSFYCRYLKTKLKNPLKQVQFVTNYHKQRNGKSLGKQLLGVGKLHQIIRRQKSNRYQVNIDDYLRTTKIFKNLSEKQKQSVLK